MDITTTFYIVVIIIVIFIGPYINAKSYGKKYMEEYLNFFKKNGIQVSIEDQNLLKIFVRKRSNGNLEASIFAFCLYLVFYNNLNVIVFIIIIIVMILNYISSYTKFKRSCPYCESRVKLSSDRCHKCTKNISNYWVGKPILEQYHKH